MRNIYKYKDWDKASQENQKLNNKRTSIKRLFEMVEKSYENQETYFLNGYKSNQVFVREDGSDLIEYNDNDPNFEYELYVPDNKHIISGKYIIGYTLEWKQDEDDVYSEYYFLLDGGATVDNSHKQIPLIVKTLKEIFNFSE